MYYDEMEKSADISNNISVPLLSIPAATRTMQDASEDSESMESAPIPSTSTGEKGKQHSMQQLKLHLQRKQQYTSECGEIQICPSCKSKTFPGKRQLLTC